jgi:coenzyme PQQ precursor peptide PqqA
MAYSPLSDGGGRKMRWMKPKAVELRCGMEINMYGPAEDDDRTLV